MGHQQISCSHTLGWQSWFTEHPLPPTVCLTAPRHTGATIWAALAVSHSTPPTPATSRKSAFSKIFLAENFYRSRDDFGAVFRARPPPLRSRLWLSQDPS